MEYIRKIVFLYKSNPILRVLFVIIFSIALWFVVYGGLKEGYPFRLVNGGMTCMLIVAGMEYMTINMLYEMDFPPVDVFARRTFGDKKSFGYQATYVVVYFGMWVMAVVAFMDKA